MSDLKDEIVKLGWLFQDDRGMSENNGYLFQKDNYELRYWTPHPRFNISKNKKIIYDTMYDNFEIDLTISDIEETTKKFAI
jgi:hypothetical protein